MSAAVLKADRYEAAVSRWAGRAFLVVIGWTACTSYYHVSHLLWAHQQLASVEKVELPALKSAVVIARNREAQAEHRKSEPNCAVPP